jgi:hypothetical protein
VIWPIFPAAKSSEIVVLLDRASDLLSRPLHEIKGKVEAALESSGVEKLKGVLLRGIRALPCNRLLVVADSDKAASLLRRSASYWAPRLEKNCSLVVPRCQIVVNGVPTSFKPSSPTAAQEIHAHNRGTIADPSVISEVRWLNPKAVGDPAKKASSLLITLSDVPSADLSIARGLAVESAFCYPHRYEEPPLLCFNCQGYGHTQHQCKQKTPTCAHCAGLHRTSSCPCTTSSTKCGPGKRCKHYSPRCANCQGKHPAFHWDCPVRVKECEAQTLRLWGQIFFDPAFDPYTSVRDKSQLLPPCISLSCPSPHSQFQTLLSGASTIISTKR